MNSQVSRGPDTETDPIKSPAASSRGKKVLRIRVDVIALVTAITALTLQGAEMMMSKRELVGLDVVSIRESGNDPSVTLEFNVRNRGFRDVYIDKAEFLTYDDYSTEVYSEVPWEGRSVESSSLLASGRKASYTVTFKNLTELRKYMPSGRKIEFSVTLQSGKTQKWILSDSGKSAYIGKVSTYRLPLKFICAVPE